MAPSTSETPDAPGASGAVTEAPPGPVGSSCSNEDLSWRLEKFDEGILEDIRRMDVWEVVANQVAFMATPLLMPSLLARTGWVLGIGFCLYSAVLTYMTGLIIGDICVNEPHLHTYSLVAEEAFARLGARVGAPRRLCGRVGSSIVGFLQFASYYLTGVAELIYFEQYLAALFQKHALCQRTWLLIAAAMCWPCVQIPTFKESRWLAMFTCFIITFNVFVFIYEIASVRPWTECSPGPQWPQPSGADMIRGMVGIAYAFGGHGLFPEQLREMKKPERWPKAVAWTYSIVVPVYLFFGCAGYFAFGHHAKANLNLNYPDNVPNTLSIVAQSMQELYYVAASMIVLVLKVELFLGVSPAAWCREPRELGPPTKEQESSAWQACANGDSAEYSTSSSDTDTGDDGAPAAGQGSDSVETAHAPAAAAPAGSCFPKRWRDRLSLRGCGAPPGVFRLVFRTLFLGSQAGLALLMLGGDGDVLLSLQALAGAVGFTALTYFLPLVFGWALLPKVRAARCLFYLVSFVMCGLLMAVGIYFSVADLIDTAGGFGADVQCKIDADEYLSDACHAALGNSVGDAV